ncbi:putative very-long-chain 3-oxoacyl-CoA reductase [Rosa chinensis]|uniref:Putative very-long-chain 3-oxoacyl-CoA reductase n=1 Tax=Rosa chinensis TaxID=74649 RepID=A0A2P6R0V6_ROSCH|nr:very-long-chain 3-oxoacyl-CoA reductase 1 isoform X2 [Rosa chinensis]PRQ40072.1 putative very-long-chain 3-oxoacyl-CoA reductase [Rosa chinensis]
MELPQLFMVAATTIGFISVCKASINFVRWVYVMFLRPTKNLRKYGSWAIITGSTDGIGKALAFEMASKGLNLVLVGRNPCKLEATSHGIHEKYGNQVEIKNVVIDLAKLSGEEIARAIEEGIKGLDVGVLVNNAGVAYPYAKFFHEVDLELMESITRVNIEAATWVCKAVIPGMLKKKRGAIVNIGSGSSVIVPSYPLFTVYAASKACLAMFSRCTSLEYKQQGIDIQCQIPFFVATKMTKLKASSFLIASPETYSKASIRCIGYEHLCTPYWGHSVQWFIARALPDALLNASIFRYFLGMRKRGQLKESRIKKMQQQENALGNHG